MIERYAPNALNILDRYHLAAKMNEVLDKIRAPETRAIASGKGVKTGLTHSRWCWLKRPEPLTEKQSLKLKDLLACNPKTIRADLLKEGCPFFWEYRSPVGPRRLCHTDDARAWPP